MTVEQVLISGRRGGTTHFEVELLASLPKELRLIGGLAVMVRVGTPHRTTVDLDTVTRDLAGQHQALSKLAVSSTNGGQYTFEGMIDLDVIDVAPVSAEELIAALVVDSEPLTDLEMNAVAHTWAHDSAAELQITAVDEVTGEVLAATDGRLVATTSGLIAMKATTIPLRASARPEKKASDLYDLGRLIVAGKVIDANFASMPSQISEPILERLNQWFVSDAGRDRTYREVRRYDEPALDLDDVADGVADLER